MQTNGRHTRYGQACTEMARVAVLAISVARSEECARPKGGVAGMWSKPG